MFTPSLTHVLPLWLNFSLLFTLRIPQINDISFENCLFHLIIVSVFTHSWNTRTTSTYTNIIDQNKEIKNAIFVFSPLLRSIEWTDYCTTGNGGKGTAHVVPALIRVCGFSGRSRGGAWGAQPPLIFRPKWGPKGRKKFFLRPGSPPYLRVWMTAPALSEDLDPPLGFSVSLSVWFHVLLFPFGPSGKISTSTSDDQRSKWIRFIQVFVHFYLCVYI